jgi:EAL domain-containing protein (putative c-di-GMP-specific phosphodiesterase class I)
MRLEAALRRALKDRQEFCIHYQPIVAAGTGALVQVEALARWQSRTMGNVPPDRFIAIAEQTGLISDLGQLLLELIAADMARAADLRVSINISPLQLLMPTFQDELVSVLQAFDVPPHRVEVELTEGVLVSNFDLAAFRLDSLREKGFSTALDDFGTGFSAIGTLRLMPFDRLKIDRSFLTPPAHESTLNAALIHAVVKLGHSVGKTVICEGVETEEQARLLTGIGCDLLQGYLFGRPMPLADLQRAFPPWNRAAS